MKTEEFLRKAREKHGDEYCYSKVTADPLTKQKVVITCKEHGDFLQQVTSHLCGRGCPECGRRKILGGKPLSLEQYIKKAREVHGDTYDYSKVVYKGSRVRVIIICKVHGEFMQWPHSHLQGSTCLKCSTAKRAVNQQSTMEQFLDKANKKHSGRFCYSKVNSPLHTSRVIIGCPDHGDFEQTVASHLAGKGCPHCAREFTTGVITSNTGKYVTEVSKRHDYGYDYSKVEYIHSEKPVTIVCPKHGEFQIIAAHHMTGSRCGKCVSEDRDVSSLLFTKWGEERVNQHLSEHGDKPFRLYLLNFNYKGKHSYKVGITRVSVEDRVKSMLMSKKIREQFSDMRIVYDVPMNLRQAFTAEQSLLKEFSKIGTPVDGKFGGHTETFYIPPSDSISQLFLSHLPAGYTST